MKIRKKTLALLLFSTGFICTVAASSLVLWQTDVLELPHGQQTEPVVSDNVPNQGALYPALLGDGLWGYINERGTQILPYSPQAAPASEQVEPLAAYQEVRPFLGKTAWVKQNGLWGAIDLEGNFIVPAEYESIEVYKHSNTYFVAAYNALSSPVYPEPNTALYDVNGAKLFGVSGRLGPLCDGLMAFSRKRGEQVSWGYINPHGEIVIEPIYAEVGQVSGNFALVRDFDGRTLLLNIYAKNAVEAPELTTDKTPDLDVIGSRLVLAKNNGKFGYVSVTGGVAIDFVYDQAMPFQGGAALVWQAGRAGLIAPDGSLVVPAGDYASVLRLGNGLYAFKEQGALGWRVYNADGGLLLPEDELVYGFGSWQNGLCSFWTADYTSFFNMEGQVQPGLRLDLQPGVFRLGNLFGVQDVNGQTWFDEHGHTVWSVGRDQQLTPEVNLLTVLENRSANYLVYYPQTETLGTLDKGQTEIWSRLNRVLEDNALGEYYESYELRGELQFVVRGDFELIESGAVMTAVQHLHLDDSWRTYEDVPGGQEDHIATACFDKETGQLYALGDLFKPGVNWRSELLEPARGTYSVRQAGLGLPENPEVQDFLERRLPRIVEFSLGRNTLTLYTTLSDGSCQSLEIYYQDIEELIDMEGELWLRLKGWQNKD